MLLSIAGGWAVVRGIFKTSFAPPIAGARNCGGGGRTHALIDCWRADVSRRRPSPPCVRLSEHRVHRTHEKGRENLAAFFNRNGRKCLLDPEHVNMLAGKLALFPDAS
jgi:hypothetical protein